MERNNLSTSIIRGCAILTSFTSEKRELGLTEIAQSLQLNKATAHRYLRTLKALGYLEQDPDTSKYRLGIRVLDLGLAVLSSMEAREIALPFLEDLAEELDTSVSMSVLDGDEIVYIERVRSRRLFDIDLHVGSRLPAYCTSMGKVLLAALPRDELDQLVEDLELVVRGPNTITDKQELIRELKLVRRRGYAVNKEELAYGLQSIAAPIHSRTGEIVAAINTALHVRDLSKDELVAKVADRLMATAEQISRRNGYLK